MKLVWVPAGRLTQSYVIEVDDDLQDMECVCDIEVLMCQGCQCGAFEREQELKAVS